MSVSVVGISHRTAPLDVRERFVLDVQASEAALRHLVNGAGVAEAVLLSTCNRTELYLRDRDGHHSAATLGSGFLSQHAGFTPDQALRYLFTLEDRKAVEHLFRVVASLDSMVLGEAQIQGQVKTAYERAASLNGKDDVVGPILARLFESALRVGSRVRTETRLGTGAASIPSAAVDLARKIFGSLGGRKAVVLGAGDMSRLALQCLQDEGVTGVVVANRSEDHGRDVARHFGAESVSFSELPRMLQEADIVATATAAPHVVITRQLVQDALAGVRRPPLLIVDIALPRDVDPAVGEVDNVFLYDLDDLQQVVEGTLERRRSEVAVAESIIQQGVEDFWHWYRGRNVVPMIRALRGRAEAVRRSEVERVLRGLQHLSEDDRRRVEGLTRQLLAKVLHTPTTRLREAAASGRDTEIVEAARYLFSLEEVTTDEDE